MRNGIKAWTVVALLAAASGATTANAIGVSWSNPLGGSYSSNQNWTGLLLPGLLDNATFATGSALPYVVTFDANAAASQLTLGNGDSVTLNLAGRNYSLGSLASLLGTNSIEVGGLASLNVRNTATAASTLSAVYASIGNTVGTSGTLTVAGAGTKLTASQWLKIGDTGTGNLTASGGTKVQSLTGSIGDTATGIGTVVIDGSGTDWTNTDHLYVGYGGKGTLVIQNGGRVNSTAGATFVGKSPGSEGKVTVTGTGSSLAMLHANFGAEGAAELNILNGASVSNYSAYLGTYPGTTTVATIDGAGSTWTNNQHLYVGMSGTGILNIKGGTISVNNTFGVSNMGATQVNFSAGKLVVGTIVSAANPIRFLGNGTTTGWTGGTLEITKADLIVGPTGGLGSNLTIGAGKALRVTGAGKKVSVSATGALNVGGGSIYTLGMDNAGSISLPAGSNVEVVAAATNSGRIDLTGGTLKLDAGMASTGLSLREQIATAYAAGEWDGAAGIGSTLAASNAAKAVGVGYVTDGAGATTVRATWYGDANADGVVNGADLALISPDGSTWQTGDFNYDGRVSSDDWALFVIGATNGSSANFYASVPEPASVGLAGLGLAALAGRRGRRAK